MTYFSWLTPSHISNIERVDFQQFINQVQHPVYLCFPNRSLRDSGLKDELVPPAHMTKLRDAAVNARFTSFHTIEGGGHNVSGSFSTG